MYDKPNAFFLERSTTKLLDLLEWIGIKSAKAETISGIHVRTFVRRRGK